METEKNNFKFFHTLTSVIADTEKQLLPTWQLLGYNEGDMQKLVTQFLEQHIFPCFKNFLILQQSQEKQKRQENWSHFEELTGLAERLDVLALSDSFLQEKWMSYQELIKEKEQRIQKEYEGGDLHHSIKHDDSRNASCPCDGKSSLSSSFHNTALESFSLLSTTLASSSSCCYKNNSTTVAVQDELEEEETTEENGKPPKKKRSSSKQRKTKKSSTKTTTDNAVDNNTEEVMEEYPSIKGKNTASSSSSSSGEQNILVLNHKEAHQRIIQEFKKLELLAAERLKILKVLDYQRTQTASVRPSRQQHEQDCFVKSLLFEAEEGEEQEKNDDQKGQKLIPEEISLQPIMDPRGTMFSSDIQQLGIHQDLSLTRINAEAIILTDEMKQTHQEMKGEIQHVTMEVDGLWQQLKVSEEEKMQFHEGIEALQKQIDQGLLRSDGGHTNNTVIMNKGASSPLSVSFCDEGGKEQQQGDHSTGARIEKETGRGAEIGQKQQSSPSSSFFTSLQQLPESVQSLLSLRSPFPILRYVESIREKLLSDLRTRLQTRFQETLSLLTQHYQQYFECTSDSSFSKPPTYSAFLDREKMASCSKEKIQRLREAIHHAEKEIEQMETRCQRVQELLPLFTKRDSYLQDKEKLNQMNTKEILCDRRLNMAKAMLEQEKIRNNVKQHLPKVEEKIMQLCEAWEKSDSLPLVLRGALVRNTVATCFEGSTSPTPATSGGLTASSSHKDPQSMLPGGTSAPPPLHSRNINHAHNHHGTSSASQTRKGTPSPVPLGLRKAGPSPQARSFAAK